MLKRAWRVASTALVVILAVLALVLVGVRLVGFEVYTVLSGSMEPAFRVGSVIWVDKCEADEVAVGDPITFVLNEDLAVATHRVIEIDAGAGCFYTKGDANDAPDAAPVLFENLVGKPVFTVPHLGYVVSYVQQPPGLYAAVAACAFLLLLAFLPELLAKDGVEGKRSKRADAKGKWDERKSAQAAISGARRASAPCSDNRTLQQVKAPRHARGVAPSATPTQVNNPRLRQQTASQGRLSNR